MAALGLGNNKSTMSLQALTAIAFAAMNAYIIPMEILKSATPVEYQNALAIMDSRAIAIRENQAVELMWLLEHPPLYTAGTSSNHKDLGMNVEFPVFQTGRGGQYTYHGPGQRIAYLMLDLKKHQQTPDIKKYVWQLEEWIIRTLSIFGIQGERRQSRVGIWVVMPDAREAKIAAIGVRIRQWVTMHGVSINVDPDLSHYAGIVPCGIKEHGVISMAKMLGRPISMEEFDAALMASWHGVFAAPERNAA